MESFFGRYKNPLVLMGVLFIQIIALATQVKRPADPRVPNSPGTRLIRVWTVTAFTPIERAVVGTGHFFSNAWHNWIDLHGVRKQNQELQAEVERMRMEQVRLRQDAEQARRLQVLLGFREKFISQTVAAQVIGTSGSEQSRVVYIDRGSHDGMKTDMAVITPDGIVGKIKEALPLSSQVLLINDRDSGAGVILEKSRLQGVLKGASLGEMHVDGVMADEKVEVGENIISSGGDRIFPKGLPVGTVTSATPDRDSGAFLVIKVKPAADLNRLEEVLVVTKMADQAPATAEDQGHVRAADILAQRLPSVPKSDQQQPATAGPGTGSANDNKKKKVATGLTTQPGTATDQTAKAKPNKSVQTSQPKPDETAPPKKAVATPPEEQNSQKPVTKPQPPSTTENPPR
ncbi:MAG TPA: rod shape-determining protein MreC [Candidatus Angelobacter sp.]